MFTIGRNLNGSETVYYLFWLGWETEKQLNRNFEVKCMRHHNNFSFIILFCCTALKINWTGGEFPWSWLLVLEMFNTLVQKYIPYLLKCLVFFRRLLKLLMKNYNRILYCLTSTKIFFIVLLYTDVMLKDCIVFSISKIFINKYIDQLK